MKELNKPDKLAPPETAITQPVSEQTTDNAVVEGEIILEPLHRGAEGRDPHNKIDSEIRELIVQAAISTRNITKTAKMFDMDPGTISNVLKEYRAEMSELTDLEFQSSIEKTLGKMLGRLETEADKLKVGQLPVAAGILLDKRRDLKANLRPGAPILNLKVAWKDGSGAVELTTGQPGQGGTGGD